MLPTHNAIMFGFAIDRAKTTLLTLQHPATLDIMIFRNLATSFGPPLQSRLVPCLKTCSVCCNLGTV